MPPAVLTERRTAALLDRETPLTRRYLKVVQKWVPVGLKYFQDWPVRPNCGHFFGGCSWYGHETTAGALTFAMVASSPEYDPAIGGVSVEELRRIALKALRYICFTHDTGPADCVRPERGLGRPENFGTKWGERGKGFFRESQCGRYVAKLGIAAMLLGDLVDDETWGMLAAIHEDYADRFAAMAPKSGIYTNTQMEENAWTSLGLASVECFLSNHPSAAPFSEAVRRWMFLTVTTPQDTKDHALFSGERTVRQLVGETFTALPDYWTENHGMIHPTYTASCLELLNTTAVVYGVHGRGLPEQALFNRRKVYDHLKKVTECNGYMHPVQGMDWPYLSPDPGTQVHSAASVCLRDPDGARFERRALETLERRQAGYGGTLFDPKIAEACHTIQDPLLVLETNIVRSGLSYLLHRLLGDGPAPTGEDELERKLRGTAVYPHSGFAFHRHRRGQTSFSWRNSIMALPLTSDGICTVAPASNSFLGTISVRDRPDSHEQVSLHVDRHQDGFSACLVMDRAQRSVRQEVLFASLPSGATLSLERFTAKESVTVEWVEQGFLRIINEDFSEVPGNCNGYRLLYSPEAALRFEGGVNPDPDSDRVETWGHPAWLNLDDRLGLVFRGTGKTVYHNRHYFKPWWAVADDLALSRVDRPFRAKSGDQISELVALVAPDQPHGRTAKQTLTVLSTRKRAAGLIADEHLAAASFEGKAGAIALTAKRRDANVPVFAGTARVSAKSVAYSVWLEAGESTLRRALATVDSDGDLTVLASEAGEVMARNTGRGVATVRSNRSKKAVKVKPGAVVAL